MAACGGGSETPDPGGVEIEEPLGDLVERSERDQRAAERRERLRQRAIAENEVDFSYYRYRIDTGGDTPVACFVFSAPLDPELDYSPYVDFRSAFQSALSVSGSDLCVGGLEFGTSQTAILKSGLPAADGRILEASEEVPIDFDDRPPYVGFRGAGVILPRSDADGLPVETVNVDQVRLTVSYVPDRVLYEKSISQGETAQQGRYTYLYGDQRASDVAEEIWTGTMDVDALQNAPVVTVFPLEDVIGQLEPGAYFVEIEDAKEMASNAGPPASAKRWIVLTDLALTAYRGEHGLDLTLRSLQDGQEVIGANVQLVAYNNDVLAETETDANGRVSFSKPIMSGNGNAAPKLVMAYGARGDLAVLDLTRAPVDLSEMGTGGRATPGPVDAYLYTERGIYRPGETVYITSLLRDRAGVAIEDRAGQLVVYRPNGMEAQKLRFSETGDDAGGISLDYPLARDAARGNWRAVLEIDGVGYAGSVSWSVEDFVPQRIAVELDADEETPIRVGETRPVTVDTRFLYGAPGAGLKVESRARLQRDPSPFEGLDGFRFGRHDEQFREEILEMPTTTSDGAGIATVRLQPGRRGAASSFPLRLNTVVSVEEPGGRAVSESLRVPYRPADLYIGVKPDFDRRAPIGETTGFEVAAVGADGTLVSQQLSWKILAINYHYDWYREDGRWRWRRSRTVDEIREGLVNTATGATAKIDVADLEWGSHELIVEGPDGRMASYSFYAGWGGRVSDDGVEAPDRVEVSLVDDAVLPGRTAELVIVPPYDGEAQIVVATDRILSVETRPVSAEGTRVTLPVNEDWGEGAYVMVSVYTPRDPVLDAKPRRAVGVAYAPVNMENRTFELTINAPDVVRPRREQLIEVEIDGGPREPVYLTLAAVDEGILQLTKFSDPDPVSYFFGQKALGVSLYDDYGRLLDPNLGLPAEVRTGGDQLGGEGLSVVPTKTVALFSGIVDVGRSGSAKVRFDLPDFNGELRLMAVAWSDEGLGTASRPITVRDPAPAELIMPRFLAPDDEAIITATLDNVELEEGEFTATVTGAGNVTPADGNVSRILPQGTRADVPVRISAGEEGISRLRLAVEGPQNYGVDHEYLIQTRSAYLPITRITSGVMQPGETFALSPEMVGGLVPGSIDMTVSFSTLPVDEGALYASLARYPYGCTEQTVSRAMPLIYAEQLVSLGADGDNADAHAKVQEAVTRILNRQSADGAFGLWREGDRHASPWLGAYATDFLYRAREEGYSVPREALDRAYGALQNVASGDAWRVYGYDTDVWESRWHYDTQSRLMKRSSAYALYVLAKAGRADISRLRYLHDRELQQIESPLAKAHLAAGLALMGDRSRASSAFRAAVDGLGYDNNGDYYQTPLRDTSAVLALAQEAGFPDLVVELSERLGTDTPDPTELTTQEKAFMLLAVNALTGGDPDEFRMDVEGLGRGNDNDRRYMIGEAQISTDVNFTYNGEAPVYRTVFVSGSPTSAPPPVSSRLAVNKRYYTLQGRSVSLADVRQGDQIVTVITMDPGERRTNPLIVADLLPAGFEIETILRPADGARDYGDDGAFSWIGRIDSAKTAEARDDRFVAALDVRSENRTLAYVVRAVTPGTFAVPGVVAEDMYRPQVNARSRATRLTVQPAETGPGGQQ
ncbi:MAG: alpha-2-macroglobulin family protein [Hyphomonadaceae bacterium]|nr:alpha-2-macroglobulin family protein [Hyphomonadaceae bacterium]